MGLRSILLNLSLFHTLAIAQSSFVTRNAEYQLAANGSRPAESQGLSEKHIASNLPTSPSAVDGLDATKFQGSDIGAKINAASSTCPVGGSCKIVIPFGRPLAFKTKITFVPNMTLECTRAGASGEYFVDGSVPSNAALRYLGRDAAVDFNKSASGTLKGCSFEAGNASTLLVISGANARVEDVYINGGTVKSKLIHIGYGATGARVTGVDLFNFQGDGIVVDHSLDTYIGNVRAYAFKDPISHLPNSTSRTLVIDSEAGGTTVQNFKGGASGLHGLVVENVVENSRPPSWIWLDDFESDCSFSDGWLFDSSLKSSEIGLSATRIWSAGSGLNCDGGGVVNRSANGIRIAGGSSIHITAGSFIRANAANGILIEGKHADIQIAESAIYSNNVAKNVNASGILSLGDVSHLKIQGNTITNALEGEGHQVFGIDLESRNSQDSIISGNTLGGNSQGGLSVPCSSGFIVVDNSDGDRALGSCIEYAPKDDGPAERHSDSKDSLESCVAGTSRTSGCPNSHRVAVSDRH